MRYLSVCSGIEAATQAWAPLGWKPVAFSEIEPFPCSVLKHHYPDVPNWGDMTKFEEWPDEEIDLLCGGTPCQSFSIAGLRAGLADPRGNLMLTFGAIAAKYRPSWLVWENVPGVLSSNGGRDFASFLGLLTGQTIPHQKWKNSGIIPGIANAYGVAWRVLDAQYVRVGRFGRAIPQRRRRVFVVGYIGDWRRAAAALFDRESLCGYPAPRRQAGQGTACGFETGPGGGRFTDVAPTMDTRAKDGPIRNQLGVGVMVTAPVSLCLNAGGMGRIDAESETFVTHALRGEGFDASEDGTGRGTPLVPVAYRTAGDGAVYLEGDVTAPLTTGTDSSASIVAIQEAATRENPASGPDGIGVKQDGSAYTIEARPVPQAVAFDLWGREGGSMPEGPHHTASVRAASGGSSRSYVAQPYAVRRLTPTECERLMGFPDGFTLVPHRGKPAADGPRYKSLGNSWAVNCAAWIGERIAMV